MKIKEYKTGSVFLNKMPMIDINHISDDDVLIQLKSEFDKGWDINKLYGDKDNYYNILHACAVNSRVNSCIWLLENGVNPNLHSGNESTAFTFFLEATKNNKDEVQNFFKFAKKLKEYGGDLSLSGYEKKSPLELYAKYNNELNDDIIDLLIENSDFENNFLLNIIFMEDKYLNFRVLKNILANHKINLKKFIEPNENSTSSESYWDAISFYCSGKHGRRNFVFVEWLHNKLGFDLEKIHTINAYDGTSENLLKVNLLGVAIHNKNKAMFDWVLKKRPEFIDDVFKINNKEYSFLEFSLISKFTTGIQLGLKKLTNKELLLSNLGKMKDLCNQDRKTLETLEKTYNSLLYKELSNKYKSKNNISKKPKI